jgi:hypothetical protein
MEHDEKQEPQPKTGWGNDLDSLDNIPILELLRASKLELQELARLEGLVVIAALLNNLDVFISAARRLSERKMSGFVLLVWVLVTTPFYVMIERKRLRRQEA